MCPFVNVQPRTSRTTIEPQRGTFMTGWQPQVIALNARIPNRHGMHRIAHTTRPASVATRRISGYSTRWKKPFSCRWLRRSAMRRMNSSSISLALSACLACFSSVSLDPRTTDSNVSNASTISPGTRQNVLINAHDFQVSQAGTRRIGTSSRHEIADHIGRVFGLELEVPRVQHQRHA